MTKNDIVDRTLPVVGKMGHEKLLELVMGQFGVMSASEQRRLFGDISDFYCLRCGDWVPLCDCGELDERGECGCHR